MFIDLILERYLQIHVKKGIKFEPILFDFRPSGYRALQF